MKPQEVNEGDCLLSILGARKEYLLSVLGTGSMLSWRWLVNVHDEAPLGRRLDTASFHWNNEVRPLSVRSRRCLRAARLLVGTLG
jgi:hypothetical protein